MATVKTIWKDNSRGPALAIAKRLIATHNGQGIPMSGTWLMDMRGLVSLGTFGDDDTLASRCVLHALCHTPANSEDLLLEMEKTIAAEFVRWHAELGRSRKAWTACWGFDLDTALVRPVRIKIFGLVFTISPVRAMNTQLEQWLSRASAHQYQPRIIKSNTLVIVDLVASSPNHAVSDPHIALETLRGVLEMMSNFGVNRWGSTVCPLGSIGSPTWCMAIPKEGNSEIFGIRTFTLSDAPPRRSKVAAINFNKFCKFRKWLKDIREDVPKGSTNALMGSLFRLYVQALDEPWDYSALLGFWRVIEAAVRVKPGQTRDAAIEKRIEWLLCNKWIDFKPLGTLEAISKLEKKRHKFVHSGLYHAEVLQDDLNYIKEVAENCIHFVTQYRERLPDIEDMDRFFQMVQYSSDDRKRIATSTQLIADRESGIAQDRAAYVDKQVK